MTHPFGWIPARSRGRVLAALATAALAAAAYLGWQGRALHTRTARGIVDFELTFNVARAAQVLQEWGGLRSVVRVQLQVDFAFLALYSAALSLACVMLAESPHGPWRRAGYAAAWAMLVAGVLDATENVGLLGMLAEGASRSLVLLSTWASAAKWVLILASVAYVGSQGVMILLNRFVLRGRAVPAGVAPA